MKLKKYQQEEFIALGEQELIYRAQKGIRAFTLFTKPDYEVNWHHKLLCDKLNKFARGEIKRLIVSMPPRHGKSELVSRRLPAYILGRNPNASIISTSYGDDLASRMNRDVQRIIDSPEYAKVFPNTTLWGSNVRTVANGSYQRNSDLFEIVGHRGSYRSAGVGGGITGMGADFAIIDDPIKNHEQADSITFRDRLWDWYLTTLYTRMEKGGGILITMTRWHEDDLVGRLLKLAKEDPTADQWEVLELPAIRDTDHCAEDPRKMGEALWPQKYDLTALTKIKAGGSRNWNSLYQQRPSSEQGVILQRSWMQKRYKVLPDLDRIVISADLRFKEDSTSGDWVVMDCWGRRGAQKYFIDQIRGRWSFTESVAQFERFCAKHPKAREKLIENKANGPALENVLKKRISGMILVEPDGGKIARANAITPQWEAGDVFLPDESIWPEVQDVVEEYVSFPYAAHDDRVDTMSQALLRLESGFANSLRNLVL